MESQNPALLQQLSCNTRDGECGASHPDKRGVAGEDSKEIPGSLSVAAGRSSSGSETSSVFETMLANMKADIACLSQSSLSAPSSSCSSMSNRLHGTLSSSSAACTHISTFSYTQINFIF